VKNRAGLDAVIEAYKRQVDRTLLRENLRRTPEERVRALEALLRAFEALRAAGPPKDLETAAELEAILEETGQGSEIGH